MPGIFVFFVFVAIIALVLLSSCFYVWTIVKSLLPKPALKKD